MAPKPLPPDQIKPVSLSIGISEREIAGFGPPRRPRPSGK
jgi:hypothetical protein